MNALEDNTMVKAVECNDSLVPHQILGIFRDRLAEELLQATLVERRRAREYERLNVVVVLMMIFAEKSWFDFENTIERKAAYIEQIADRRITKIHRLDRRPGIHLNQAAAHLLTLGVIYKVGFAQENPVREADLLLRLMELIELMVRMLGIDNRYDRIKHIISGNIVVDEEGLCDRGRISQPGRLDDDTVKGIRSRFPPLPQVTQNSGEARNRSLARRSRSRVRRHLSTCVDPTEPIAKRFASSCSLVVTPLD